MEILIIDIEVESQYSHTYFRKVFDVVEKKEEKEKEGIIDLTFDFDIVDLINYGVGIAYLGKDKRVRRGSKRHLITHSRNLTRVQVIHNIVKLCTRFESESHSIATQKIPCLSNLSKICIKYN